MTGRDAPRRLVYCITCGTSSRVVEQPPGEWSWTCASDGTRNTLVRPADDDGDVPARVGVAPDGGPTYAKAAEPGKVARAGTGRPMAECRRREP